MQCFGIFYGGYGVWFHCSHIINLLYFRSLFGLIVDKKYNEWIIAKIMREIMYGQIDK